MALSHRDEALGTNDDVVEERYPDELAVEVRDLIVVEGGFRLGLTSGGRGRMAVGIRSSDAGNAVSRTRPSGT